MFHTVKFLHIHDVSNVISSSCHVLVVLNSHLTGWHLFSYYLDFPLLMYVFQQLADKWVTQTAITRLESNLAFRREMGLWDIEGMGEELADRVSLITHARLKASTPSYHIKYSSSMIGQAQKTLRLFLRRELDPTHVLVGC